MNTKTTHLVTHARKRPCKKIRKKLSVGIAGTTAKSRIKPLFYAGFRIIPFLEARGIEPLSWTLLTQASPCSDADWLLRWWSALRRPSTSLVTCGCHAGRGYPALHLPTEL